ncbi:B3/4 domain-containing protein [Thalassococcus sp. BH17M4-6]|uniref:B3/B4 domain-containing protein n=1 Tax=Thalassococcus sp. BH17M4-6 TaxID=3413148 RepID=UPI003BBF8235
MQDSAERHVSEPVRDMYFYHADSLWDRFPELSVMVTTARGVASAQDGKVAFAPILAEVSDMLDASPEGQLPAIQAWRQAYSKMGLKPTQYRCAAEALLRRFRKDGQLPRFHPVVDSLNAESMRAAIPVAVYDLARVADGLCVRPATGNETYETFQGDVETPAEDEVVFVDAQNRAHARRWVYRQAATSTVGAASDDVLIVAEAMHADGPADLAQLGDRLTQRAAELGVTMAAPTFLTADKPRYDFEGPAQ